MVEIINSHTTLVDCPFCHEPGFLFREPLWNGSHGYYGNYRYYVGCNNEMCKVQPHTKAYNDIYEASDFLIPKCIEDWNNR